MITKGVNFRRGTKITAHCAIAKSAKLATLLTTLAFSFLFSAFLHVSFKCQETVLSAIAALIFGLDEIRVAIRELGI